MGILDHNPDLADVIRGDAHAQALIAESEAYRRQLEERASTPAPEPRPLQPDLEAAAPYPLDALPPLMRDAAQAIAEHVQAPLALAGHNQLLTSDGKQFSINPLATTATAATKPSPQGPATCDIPATSCDKSPAALAGPRLSQPVATLSQTSKPAKAGLVAAVANVASQEQLYNQNPKAGVARD